MRHLFRGAAVCAAAVLLSVGLTSPAHAAPEDCNLSIEDESQPEGDADASMTFTVTATTTDSTACEGVEVSYFFNGDTAEWDVDFTADDGTADPFGTGTTQTRDFDAVIVGDDEVEPDETFDVEVQVSDDNGKVVFPTGTSLTATGTITNDDVAPPGLAPGAALNINPSSGPPGTVIEVRGTGCTNTEVEVFLVATQGESGGFVGDPKMVPVNADRTWATTITIPKDADPEFDYFVGARCGDDFYDNQPFDVTSEGESGYRMVAADGGIFNFGERDFHGSTGNMTLNKPIVGGATDKSDYEGYWIVASDGGVFSFSATFYGSLAGRPLASPAVEIEPTPTGKGYWIVLANGKVHAFGDARTFGDMSGQPLNRSIIGMAVTPSGQGYWLVGSDGGIFNFGDAKFHGSMGNAKLNAPITDLAPAVDNGGYYLLGGDGGVFAFGSAVFKGSTGSIKLNAPVTAMLVSPTGSGYWLAATDGGVFTFGPLPFHGSMGATRLNSPVLDLIN